MYAGRIVEEGSVEEVLTDPQHPYTKGLLHSIPSLGKRGKPLSVITGIVPNPFRMPPGCKFQPRCPFQWAACSETEPGLIDMGTERTSRCWVHDPRYGSQLEVFESDVIETRAAG
jgi:oligopeptide/dipeptide ABC transporter ATP-binding protein